MLDVHELNVFLAAAETENFSAAARHLNLTQPAVSMQIRGLERRLGVDLFHRSGRTLVLSEQGRALIPMARDIVKRSIQIEEEIEALKGEVVGQLKIGCSTTTGKYYLPPLVARFRQHFPKVSVIIDNQSREMVLDALCEGLVHLAVVSTYPDCADVECRHFFDDHVVLVVPVNHPWATRPGVTPQDLCQTDFIMRASQSGTREEVANMLRKVDLTLDHLKIVMEIGNSEAISMAVEEGIGVAFIPRTVARRGIELGRLKEMPVEGISLQREVFIAYSQRHPATRAQAAFWDFIQEPVSEQFLASAA